MKDKNQVERHPLAVAWDKWLASDEGRKASMPETLGTTLSARQHLENRLQCAFMAGANAVEKSQTTLSGDDAARLSDDEIRRRCEFHEGELRTLKNEGSKVWRLRVRRDCSTPEDRELLAAIQATKKGAAPAVLDSDVPMLE